MNSSSPDVELWSQPRWRAEDLGLPLPPSPHAVSVCLPQWQDVVDYEEKRPRVITRLQAGYPRFVVPPFAVRFFDRCRERLARPGERCLAYPSERAARRCAASILRWSGATARVVPWPEGGAFVVCYPEGVHDSAQKYWRHTGDGISSRCAEALLADGLEPDAAEARRRTRAKIAALVNVPLDHVFLFSSGMAAIYTVHRALEARRPGARCAQFGFPYVDTLKILQDVGAGAAFFPHGHADDLAALAGLAATEPLAGVFCEFPSNPLLNTPDVAALAAAVRPHGAPLVVDETIASYANANVVPGADIVVSSLTKFFTGRGDVMAGAAVVNPAGPFAAELLRGVQAEYEDVVWGGDALLVDRYSDDFPDRMRQVNATTAALCDELAAHPAVAEVYYPGRRDRARYDAYRFPGGGYSGLFSLVLKDAARASAPFFDRLAINKGPNLGTTFSLCCPFTLLAHYDELDWAERCGVSRHLIRFSIGLEPLDDLRQRLRSALTG